MENNFYPKIKNAVLLCLLLIGLQVGLGLLLGIFQLVFNLSDSSIIMGISYIFLSIISFGIVILIGFKKSKRSFNEMFKFNPVSPYLWVSIIIFSIGYVIVQSELDNLLMYLMPIPEWFNNIFETFLVDQPLILSVIYIGFVAAFSEELFFRGLVLDGLSHNYSKRKAIIISALLFGIIHLNPWQFLTAFISGLIMAWICIESKSIWLCIYLHLFNNVLYTITARNTDLIPIRGFNKMLETSVEFQPIWFTLSGLIILTIGVLMFIKGVRESENPA